MFTNRFGAGRTWLSFVEKVLLFTSEIIPTVFLMFAVFIMKAKGRTSSQISQDLSESMVSMEEEEEEEESDGLES